MTRQWLLFVSLWLLICGPHPSVGSQERRSPEATINGFVKREATKTEESLHENGEFAASRDCAKANNAAHNDEEVDVKNPSANELTPLHEAARDGKLETVKELLAGGACVDSVDEEEGMTPLHYAAMKGHADIVETLLEAGVNVHAVAKTNRWTPLLLSAYYGPLEVVEVLLAHMADVKELTYYRSTPLTLAVRAGHKDIAEVLLDSGADIDAVDRYGKVPLHYAVLNRRTIVIWVLLTGGANVDAADKDQWTPLHYAAHKGLSQFAVDLVAAGASTSSVTSSGEKPVDLVCEASGTSCSEATEAFLIELLTP